MSDETSEYNAIVINAQCLAARIGKLDKANTDLHGEIATIKTHFNRRCDNLTRARDERQAGIDAALVILAEGEDLDVGDGAAGVAIIDRARAALSGTGEA